MYIADYQNHRIRKISTAGEVTTFAGSTAGFNDGIGASAKFKYPRGICIDSQNNLFVTDGENDKIRKVTPSGEVSTIAGSSEGFSDGTATEAKFNNPFGITIDLKGNLYVSDRLNYKIRKITQAGVVTTVAGSTSGFVDGLGADAKFSNVQAIQYYRGKIYVGDVNHLRIIQ